MSGRLWDWLGEAVWLFLFCLFWLTVISACVIVCCGALWAVKAVVAFWGWA